MTPEEKLLRAIFGEKASDVRDTSLRLPPGVPGTVVEVRVFNRHGIDIDDRTRAIQTEEKERLKKDADDERAILNRATFSRLREMLLQPGRDRGAQGRQEGRDDRRRDARERRAATNGGRSPSRTTSARPTSKRSRRQYDEAASVITAPLRGPRREARARRRAAAGRAQDGQGVRRGEAQAAAGRQDGRPSRQQGRHQPHPADRGHAVPRGRDRRPTSCSTRSACRAA